MATSRMFAYARAVTLLGGFGFCPRVASSLKVVGGRYRLLQVFPVESLQTGCRRGFQDFQTVFKARIRYFDTRRNCGRACGGSRVGATWKSCTRRARHQSQCMSGLVVQGRAGLFSLHREKNIPHSPVFCLAAMLAGGFQRGNGEFGADKKSTVLVTFFLCCGVKGGSRASKLIAGAGLCWTLDLEVRFHWTPEKDS